MNNKSFNCLLYVFFIITILFLIAPLFLLINRGVVYIIPCLRSEEVLFSIKLSLKTAIISTFICLIFSIPTSYILVRHEFKYKKLISSIIYLPMSLPHIVSGIALLLLFGKSSFGNFLYNKLNLDFIFTVKGIILAQVFVNLSFTIKILATSLEESNTRMEFIARTLGCNEFEAFRYITIPKLKKGTITAIIMTWSRALWEFGAVMMVAGSTRMKTEIIPTSIFLNMSTGDLDTAIGVATILIIISLISIITFEIIDKKKS
ncbi:ABC transporter permease [Clostridium botulinum]|uniref:ABC transporter permease n=1 Tax=Clostridium botulinum TaxID=1491 RepID=UPI00077304F9|nr:ABC transporter permease [Clostridium botulinum]